MENRHHIFCNIQHGPPEDCRQCKVLKEKYPEDGMTGDELVKKHFPDVQLRSTDEDSKSAA